MRFGNGLALAGLVFVGLLVCRPLMGPGIRRTHDGMYALVKAAAMSESWHQGDPAARWTRDIAGGYGYPMFNFYAPLFFYLVAALSFVVPFLAAYQSAWILVFVAAGGSMYLLARDVYGREGALVAGAAYLLAPYHLLNLYVRGAPAELTAMALFPLALWAMRRTAGGAGIGVFAAGTLALTGVLLAHNIMAMLFALAAAVYAVFLVGTAVPGERVRVLGGCAGMAAAAGGLSAYFWLPAMAERGLVQLERITGGYYQFAEHFVAWHQLLYSPWGPGGSGPGLNDGMSFMAGPGLLVLAVAGWSFLLLRRGPPSASRSELVFFAGFAVISLGMTMAVSRPLWEAFPMLRYVQFPWRWLALAVLLLAFTAGGSLWWVPQKHRALLAWGIVLVLLGTALPLARGFGNVPVAVASTRIFLDGETPRDNMEFLPAQAPALPLSRPPARLQALEGDVHIEETPGGRYPGQAYRLRSGAPALMLFHTYRFPGWKVLAGDRELPLLDNPAGLILFALPAGDHKVRVLFADTPARVLGRTISAVTLLLCAVGGGLVLFRRQRAREGREAMA